jgi:hypothetical protein
VRHRELTLQHSRLKDNFSIIKAEDRQLLLEAKDEVETEMNKKKWQLIADKVKQKGGDEYSVSHTGPGSEA